MNGYYVMIDHQKSVAYCTTIPQARRRGKALAKAEPLPATFSIITEDGEFVEEIPGLPLEQQVANFARFGHAQGEQQ